MVVASVYSCGICADVDTELLKLIMYNSNEKGHIINLEYPCYTSPLPFHSQRAGRKTNIREQSVETRTLLVVLVVRGTNYPMMILENY